METLTQVQSLAEAEVIKGLLAASGIEAFIPDQLTSQVLPLHTGLGAVRIQVAAEDLDRAKAILAEEN